MVFVTARNVLSDPAGAACAQQAMDRMRQHGVTPTPTHYEVWLAYQADNNPALKAAIEARIAAGASLGDEFTAQLHEQYFGNAGASAQIVLTSERIARDLNKVVSFLQQAEERSGDYGRTLEVAATDLNRGLDPEQVRQLISSLAAATLDMVNHNKHLNEQLQKSGREIESLRSGLESVRVESLTDALTGLSNRRMFDETLRMRIDEARAQKSELCLVLCDVDFFKRFNDAWGHHTGDQILRFLASAMQAHARPDFLVARYGGEEFAMIMPRTDIRMAAQIGNVMRDAIQAKRLRRRSTNEDLGQVTVSLGAARLSPSDTPQGLVERADACLYASKRDGRNRLTTDAAPVQYVA